MRIRTTKDFEHDLAFVDDKDNTTIKKVKFPKGSVMDVEIIDSTETTVDVQFLPSGACAFNFPKENYEEGGLSLEQVENWRKVLFSIIGPYAMFMTKEEIEAYRDKVESHCNNATTLA